MTREQPEHPDLSGRVDEAVDLDLLADFACGALDDTKERLVVADRIASDPRWAAALAALRVADEAVATDLAALGAATPPMPVEVAARLEAALATAHDPLSTPPERSPQSSARPNGSPGGNRGPAGRADSRTPGSSNNRRRSRRWAMAGALAAVLGLGGVGAVGVTSDLFRSKSSSPAAAPEEAVKPQDAPRSDSAGGAATPSPNGAAGRSEAQPSNLSKGNPPPARPTGSTEARTGASGTDYTKRTLGQVGRMVPGGDMTLTGVPPELTELTRPALRNACLAAITKPSNAAPTAIDYARYQGAPSLVILFSTPAGVGLEVVVVGPQCGSPGADQRTRQSL